MKGILEERIDYSIPSWQELGNCMFLGMMLGMLCVIGLLVAMGYGIL